MKDTGTVSAIQRVRNIATDSDQFFQRQRPTFEPLCPADWGQEHLHSSLAGRNKTIGLQIESAILLRPRLSSGEPE